MKRNLLADIVRAGGRISASLLLAGAAVVGSLIPAAALFLQYDREAIAGGEVWRVLTCHFTHWSADHLAWDLFAFLGLGVFLERLDRRRFVTCLAGSAVLIPLAVWAFLPGLETYRGLSGIDSALFVFLGATLLIRSLTEGNRLRAAFAGTALAAFAVKTMYELTTGSALFVDTASVGVVPVPLAHAAGALAGLAAACGVLDRRDEATDGDGEWAFRALHRLANLGYAAPKGVDS